MKKEKMKKKRKIVAIAEIAIVLCSLFLVATLPGTAADQNHEMQKVSASTITTASEDDYVLDIYGNANEDDTIDMGDVVYTKLAIFGKKSKTELCDAKYDGRTNVLDVIQTKLIILGKEKELTVVDSDDRIVTVKKPIERLVVCPTAHVEWLRSLKVKDIIVGTGYTLTYEPAGAFFADFADVPLVGKDPEAVISQNPDAVLLSGVTSFGGPAILAACEVADIPVLVFRIDKQDPINTHHRTIKELGYIFDKEDEAEEYLDWHDSILNLITERVEKISEEDKPKVYFETYRYKAYGSYSYVAFVGGIDMFPNARGAIDPEAVIKGKPDIIIKAPGGTQGGYGVNADDTAEFEEIRAEIINRDELRDIPAVKNGRVYIISTYLLSYMPASMGKHVLQIAYQAKWIHPEIFEDLDPKAIHQEYLTRFQGLDIDLDEKGVFVYPEPS